MRHYLNQCPNIESDERYFSEWAKWAECQERTQQAQWDNYYAMIQVNASGAGPISLYAIGTNRIDTTRPDARLHESTGLTNELMISIAIISKRRVTSYTFMRAWAGGLAISSLIISHLRHFLTCSFRYSLHPGQ